MKDPSLPRLLILLIALAPVVLVTLARAQDAVVGPEAAPVDGGVQADGDLEARADVDGAVDGGLPSSGETDGDAGEVDGDAGEAGGLSTEVDPSLGLVDDRAWIFIDKSERRLVVNDGKGWRAAFRVALGQNPEGDKRYEGDGRTPEGEFYVCRRIVHNRFHRFLGLSYPGPDDAERGRAYRVIEPIEYRAIKRAARRREAPPWRTKLGGNVGIHGYGRRRDRARLHARGVDWTDGCIAVTNEEIEQIYEHTRLKTRVVIVP